MTINRRDFLRRVAAGGAIVTMPAWLQGCGLQSAALSPKAPPENPFLTWFGIDEAQVGALMSSLTSRGADFADIYFQHVRASRLTLQDGAIGNAGSDISLGAGFRVVRGDDTGFATTDDLQADALRQTALQASGGDAMVAAEAMPAFITVPPGNLYEVETPWPEIGLDAKSAIIESLDQKARAVDPSIDRVSVAWDDSDERVLIATHDGRLVTDVRPMTRITLVLSATREGATQTGFASIAARGGIDWYTDERLTDMVETAAGRTLIQFDARRAPSGELPVILAAGESAVLLHEAIGHTMEADFVLDGTSPYAGKLGESIASPLINLADDATMPFERGALNVDDEGRAAGRNVLVENGTLTSLLQDQRSARALGVTTTGSGRRESYRFEPMPRMTCTVLQNGPHTRDEIISSVDRGIYCKTYTGGSADLGAGDFEFQVKNGWLVENGKLTAPIKDVTIAGNGPQLLRDISMVADDGRMDPGGWTCGKKGQNVPVSHGMPTVLVDSLTVKA